MNTILNVIHVLLAAAMIGIILVQRGAGAAAGASFGAGASQTVFGSQGAGNFLTKTTGVLATGFFLVSLTMAMMAGRTVAPTEDDNIGVMSNFTEQTEAAPVESDAATEDPGMPAMMTDDVTDVASGETDLPAIPDTAVDEDVQTEGGSPDGG